MIKLAAFLNRDWIKARLYHLFAPLVALVLVAVYLPTGPSQLLEDVAVNLRFHVRTLFGFDPPADPRIIFIGIDQHSLDHYGKYPWPRTVIADFLNAIALANQNPHTVAFDIMYTEKSANPADDQALGDAAGLLPNVITGGLADDPSSDPEVTRNAEEKTEADLKNPGPTLPFTQIHGDIRQLHDYKIATLPVDPVRKQSLFGFVNDDPSPIDGIRHTVPLLIRIGDRIYPSLALQTLCQALDADAGKVEVNIGENVILRNASGKSWTIPMTEEGKYVINYRSRNSFKHDLSFDSLADALGKSLDKSNPKPLPPYCVLDKKILFIGEDATALTDMGPTPIESKSPLPYVHLNVINNVLQNDYIHLAPQNWVVVGWLAATWATLFRLKEAPLIEAVFTPIVAVAVYIIAAFAVFSFWSLQIVLAWPVLSYATVNFGGLVLRWREEQHGRQQLKQIFGRMLPSGLVGHLLDHPDNLNLGGSLRPVTILFSDIRDYTKFSEHIDTQELVRQLNVYFERMVPCVEECRGTLHKFIGDAIMAAWGDIPALSLGIERDARNAVRSALLMRKRLRELNEERQAAGQIPLRIGIGLNHGDVAAGQIGASIRSEFTVIGDPVNVASRLEGVTKDFHTDLAISENVRQLTGDEFLVRRLGLILLKGKTKPTVVYEVLAEKSNPRESRLPADFVAKYEEAFDHFLARRFVEAIAAFETCEKQIPGDYCVRNYLEASREFARKAPPSDWDGRIVMKTK
ncbi:MAG TPA: adenylate/guanylate cyclase domain-containing protein [Candidatus Methylacidiphilales bacterium]|nr:adenylate/guanylate cyclase domain-containing protein [Candidatus Methylacidiphilales bacterium]